MAVEQFIQMKTQSETRTPQKKITQKAWDTICLIYMWLM